jgi:phenylacetate-coenzyme A ligase PaaK-like adenylate-forming protein
MIQGIDGRLDDLIVMRGGTRVHALAILPGLQAVAGVRQVQLVQEEFDGFRLRVVWARGCVERPAELVASISAVLGEQIRVAVEPVEVLDQEPSGKVKSVLCQVVGR